LKIGVKSCSFSQREIVARIERERAILHGNRELIRFALREEKVKKVIEKVRKG
jgi:hypothetical protein